MEISLNQLKVFSVVARTLSYTAAAQELFLTQPGVSAQIHSLERSTGLKLFEQMGRRVFLTQDGHRLLDYAVTVIERAEEFEKAADDLRENPSGELRVGTTAGIATNFLTPALSAFTLTNSSVHCSVEVCSVEEIVPGIFNNSWDFGLVISPDRRTDLLDPDLEVEDLLETPPVFVASATHPWIDRETIDITELADQPLILPRRGTYMRNFLDRVFAGRGVSAHVVLESNSPEVMRRGVECGIGVALLTRMHSQGAAAPSGKLSVLKVAGLAFTNKVYLVSHRAKYRSKTMAAFGQFLHSFANEFGESKSHGTQKSTGLDQAVLFSRSDGR